MDTIKIDKLIPYNRNAKKHNTKQVKSVADSIKRFGFVQPIVIDKNNEIVIGHCRLEAAKILGLKEVPIISVENLTDKEVKSLRLADNKLNESDWNLDLVIEDLKELDEDLLDLTGFDNDLIIEEDDKDDQVPALPEEPTAKLGDFYQLGNHKIMCGDSTKTEDVEKLMDNHKADLAITDPPYNVDYEGGTGLKIQNDSMDDDKFCEFLTEAFKRIAESIKMGGSFYIWHADIEGYNFRKACKDSGLLVRQCIIWNKNSLVMGRQDYQWKHEPCLYGWKDGASHNWYGDRDKTTVYKIPEDDTTAFKWFKKNLKLQENKSTSIINCNRPSKSSEHPTMKPVELLEKPIKHASKEDDIVLDLFLGSGSTLIACEKTNRICYGMELDPRYISVILDRWQEYTGNEAIRLNDNKKWNEIKENKL